MATDNAREALEVARLKWLTDTGKTQQALEELQEELNLPDLPRRIECYDISDIMGAHPVGSMVVFIDGRPRPAEYRRFRIKTVAGANDVAMMAEVLRRRFKRAAQAVEEKAAGENEGWGALPDLLIVDGGKAQLNVALEVLREAGVPSLPAAGLAKQQEELYVKDLAEPIVLPRTSQALYLRAAHPRRGAPLRRYVPPQRTAESGYAVRARLDSRRRAETKAGAPAEVRVGAGDTGGERR